MEGFIWNDSIKIKKGILLILLFLLLIGMILGTGCVLLRTECVALQLVSDNSIIGWKCTEYYSNGWTFTYNQNYCDWTNDETICYLSDYRPLTYNDKIKQDKLTNSQKSPSGSIWEPQPVQASDKIELPSNTHTGNGGGNPKCPSC